MISDPAPTPARYRFESFILDTDDRKLLRDGQTVATYEGTDTVHTLVLGREITGINAF